MALEINRAQQVQTTVAPKVGQETKITQGFEGQGLNMTQGLAGTESKIQGANMNLGQAVLANLPDNDFSQQVAAIDTTKYDLSAVKAEHVADVNSVVAAASTEAEANKALEAHGYEIQGAQVKP